MLQALRTIFDRDGVEREMDAEMHFHIERETDANIEKGMAPDEARRAALVAFGGVERFKEMGRSARGGQWLDDMQRDVRRALRGLRTSPGFTAIALTMLALGIGANTAIFSVVNAVLIQPLPFAEPDRLVQIYESHPERGWDRFPVSQPNAIDLRERTTSFEGVGIFGGRSATLTSDGTPQQIGLATVTPGFFDVLGVTPLSGRTLRETDVDATNAQRILMLSEDLWINRFGADPRIIGSTVELDTQVYEVIGVLPRGIAWLDMDAFEPMVLDPEQLRTDHQWAAIGRLRSGIGIEVAQAEMDGLARQLRDEYVDVYEDLGFVVDPSVTWAASEELRRSLWIFLGAAGLLLVIACMNLANLQMARLDGRLRQVTLSVALGASRGRIMRQLFTESAVLGVLGGALGVLVARTGLSALMALEPGNVPRMNEVQVDGTALVFALLVSLAAGIGAGMLPAVRIFSDNIGNALREGGGKTSGSRGRHRAQSWLVGMETALSLVLLVGAGLLTRSLVEVQSVDNGFEGEGRVTFEVPVPRSYGFEEVIAFRRDFLSRVRAMPQVVAASAVSIRPVGGGNTVMGILPRGETAETFGGNLSASWRAISDDYFRSLGLDLVRGRDLEHDVAMDAPFEVVISERLASSLWPGEDPIGREAELWNDPERIGTVVGVVEDMREQGPEEGETLAVYFSYDRTGWSPINYVVHADGEPLALVPDVRRILAELDPNMPVSRVLTMDDMVESSTASRRFTMTLLGLFAGLALILALAGLYGVIAQSVSQRAKELGVRIALGASANEVIGLVMRRGLQPAVLGIIAGLVAAFWVSGLLAALLYGVSTTDPLTYLLVGALLAVAAAGACWVPARATLAMEASSVLREE
jgi:predicted permease